MNFISKITNILYVLILISIFNFTSGLYEDQIGKFDWNQNYVGKLKYSHFDSLSSTKRVIVATEENVIAALNLKSGQIVWRQVFENTQNGEIKFLNVDSEVVTVSGCDVGPWLVRAWDPDTGILLWEWSLSLAVTSSNYVVNWFLSHGRLIHIVSVPNSHLEVTGYNLKTGLNRGQTTKVPASWIGDLSKCAISLPHISCISNIDGKSKLYAVDVLSDSNIVQSLNLESFYSSIEGIKVKSLQGLESTFTLEQGQIKKIVFFKSKGIEISPVSYPAVSSLLVISFGENNVLLSLTQKEKMLQMTGKVIETDTLVDELNGEMQMPDTLGKASLSSGICKVRRDKNTSCRFVITTEDKAIILLQNPLKILWIREEALSNILAVDMLDLPVSEHDASIETEFADIENGDLMTTLTKRLTSQANQIQTFFFTLLGITKGHASQSTYLVRDEFGLHKMIVAITSVGKLYGIDNADGNIIWQKRIENLTPFVSSGKEAMLLFVQRTTRHFPHPAQCSLLAKDINTGEGVLYTFNPITGEPLDSGLVRLGYNIKQAMLLAEPNAVSLRGLVILDSKDRLHVIPESTKQILSKVAKQSYMFTVNSIDGILTGYNFAESGSDNVITVPTWQIKLGTKGQQIINVVSKNPHERVHSQGRVLPDRSVLFKYSNPNLVAVATQVLDPVHKHVLSIYLIDVVSGVIVFSVVHKRAKEPIHIVHSENWLVYTYFNDKWRRTEIATLELYEGKEQSNSTSFSSLVSVRLPIVERQAFIMPSTILSMKETITEKGITNKHVLMALANGGVLEMPWIFLDPRRPILTPPEEGMVPYMPELPIPSEALLNYNQTLSRPFGIHTVPSGLESTSLVFVHGLDIFYTRVAPSKTFDVLKEDFDHYLITIVLGALLIASYITKQLASRKALKQAWK